VILSDHADITIETMKVTHWVVQATPISRPELQPETKCQSPAPSLGVLALHSENTLNRSFNDNPGGSVSAQSTFHGLAGSTASTDAGQTPDCMFKWMMPREMLKVEEKTEEAELKSVSS
jgi:hypothetical protein